MIEGGRHIQSVQDASQSVLWQLAGNYRALPIYLKKSSRKKVPERKIRYLRDLMTSLLDFLLRFGRSVRSLTVNGITPEQPRIRRFHAFQVFPQYLFHLETSSSAEATSSHAIDARYIATAEFAELVMSPQAFQPTFKSIASSFSLVLLRLIRFDHLLLRYPTNLPKPSS